MKAERRKAWVDALRSRKYKQGRGALHPGDKEFCCLGVLCDITDPSGWIIPPFSEGFSYYAYWNGFSTRLPDALRQEVGGESIERALMQANDGAEYYDEKGNDPKTFDEIADLIEEIVPVDPV